MSDITAEQKLMLLRDIREAQDRNRMSLRQRENILYGERLNRFSEDGVLHRNEKHWKSHAGIRILLALLIFALYVILDFTNTAVFSLQTEEINRLLSRNYLVNAIDFIEEIPYTLDIKMLER